MGVSARRNPFCEKEGKHYYQRADGQMIIDIDMVLNQFGAEGWELVSFTHRPVVDISGSIGGGASSGLAGWSIGGETESRRGPSIAVFKRPIG